MNNLPWHVGRPLVHVATLPLPSQTSQCIESSDESTQKQKQKQKKNNCYKLFQTDISCSTLNYTYTAVDHYLLSKKKGVYIFGITTT